MKKKLFIVIGILVALFTLSVLKDILVKTSVEKGVELVTGLPLRIQGFRLGLINQAVGIRDLKLFNPKGYKDKLMLDMPEAYVDYNLGSIVKGKVHLEAIRIDVKEFTVVKNEKGELNLNSLKVVKAAKEGKKPGAGRKGKTPAIQIDNLKLKVGKVVYKDYSKGAEPSVKEFNVNIDEEYKNISNPYAVVSLVVVKALRNTTIANLANFDLQGLQGTISETLGSAKKVAGEAVVKAQEAVKETEETIKKTAESLTDALKLPFGSKEE